MAWGDVDGANRPGRHKWHIRVLIEGILPKEAYFDDEAGDRRHEPT